jgi:ATP-dependent protease HslVU (ClpYQ) peptidase subunit
MPAVEVIRQAMKIAADICVFTNHQLTLEEL